MPLTTNYKAQRWPVSEPFNTIRSLTAIKCTITETASGCNVWGVAADNQMVLSINEYLHFCSSFKNPIAMNKLQAQLKW